VKTNSAALASALVFSALSAAAEVPHPIVSGPIASTAVPGDASHNYIFFSSNHELAVNGYVEEEYFIEGTANTYSTPAGATGSVLTSNNPYKTRIVVRRPADRARFNGTVLIEWSNVTNGFDAENLWFFSWEHVLRSGYAWVGVSAQKVGVDRLKSWNPGRYGTLNISTDGLAYDAFAQAGQAIRHPIGIDVLGGLKPKTFLATGESQSAQRLSVFINSIMPLGNVYDGALLLSTFGQAIRTDPVVPVSKVLFEWDIQTGDAAVRQPDTSMFHRWEVAGTAHVDHHLRLSREPLELRDLAGVSSEANLAPTCTVAAIGSQVPNHYVLDAAIDHVVRWVQRGKQPPPSPLFEIASFGANGSAVIARDSSGLAQGGIRLSQIEVPTAANVGQNGGPSACARWGYHLPFDLATLDARYPSRRRYIDAVARVTRDNVRNGFLLAPDALRTIQDALASSVGAGKNDHDDDRDRFELDRDADFHR
jgi:hypothetical protein